MRAIRDYTSLLLAFIAIVSIVFAQIGGIGYGLYLWANETSFALAAWAGFKLWFYLVCTAVVSFILFKVVEP